MSVIGCHPAILVLRFGESAEKRKAIREEMENRFLEVVTKIDMEKLT